MANRALIKDLHQYVDQTVTLSGWLQRGRAGGKVLFLMLRDGTGLCQCVVEKSNMPEDCFNELKRLGQESSFTVTGTVRADERSVGGHELAVTDASIIGVSTDYPITPKAHGVDFLMKHRHLHLRSQRQRMSSSGMARESQCP